MYRCRWGTAVCAVVVLFFLPGISRGAAVQFTKEYRYQASEMDSKVSCRTIALEQVKRLLLEELGTYLESVTVVKDFKLSKDQITTLTAGVVKTEIMEEKWDGQSYFLRAKVDADPGEVMKSIDSLRRDREKTAELEEMRKRAEEALKELERLKKDLEPARQDKGKQEEYSQAVNRLNAKEWAERGTRNNRMGRPELALKDFDQAIQAAPTYARLYVGRGVAYNLTGQVQRALKDFDRAITLDSRFAPAYAHRGAAHEKLGNLDQAIQDFGQALELDPSFPPAYLNRGIAYERQRKFARALADFDRAIELDSQLAFAYLHRGLVHAKMRQPQKALKDFERALEINPRFARAYAAQSEVYRNMGNRPKALELLKAAARLGDERAQEILKKRKISW